jgi:hypothetical protein
MGDGPPLDAASELDFLENLEIEPIMATPEDGFWLYRLKDDSGFDADLSFNTHEASVQIVLRCSETLVFQWSQEGADRLQCHADGTIVISCRSTDTRTTALIRTRPRIAVTVSLLVDRH